MEKTAAVTALSALAHEGRLTIFRDLAKIGPEGMPAGEIARRMGIPANTLSASLTILAHAGLVTSRREGRSIIYSAVYSRMSELLVYLMKDCCQGKAELCAPAAEAALQAACCVHRGGRAQDVREPA